MSGRPISVCGITVNFLTVNLTDPAVCSVFYQVASHISDVRVQSTLQGVLGLGNPSALPHVDVKSDGDEFGFAYTFSNDQVKVYLPISSSDLLPIPSVVDSAICLTLSMWSTVFSDKHLRASLGSAATLGLQVVAQQLAQQAPSIPISGLEP